MHHKGRSRQNMLKFYCVAVYYRVTHSTRYQSAPAHANDTLIAAIYCQMQKLRTFMPAMQHY